MDPADLLGKRLADAVGPDAPVIGVGIDVEPVDRWHDADRRLFTAAEVEYCSSRANPAESFAGRWCAKEAVVKACVAVGDLNVRDVSITVGSSGEPLALLSDRIPAIAEVQVLVSIAHDPRRAAAVAICVAAPKTR